MDLEYYRYFLSGLLLLGFIAKGFAKPTSDDYHVQEEDYEQYDDPSVSPIPDKSTISSLRSTVPPYFTELEYTRQVKPGEDANLQCGAKNIADSNIILWYKEKALLSQGSRVLKEGYRLDNDFTLTVPKAKEGDSGDYFCNVLPQNLTMHAKLLVSSKVNQPEAQSSGSIAQVGLLLPLACSAVLSISYLDKFLRI